MGQSVYSFRFLIPNCVRYANLTQTLSGLPVVWNFVHYNNISKIEAKVIVTHYLTMTLCSIFGFKCLKVKLEQNVSFS